jgi:thymidylate kinase
MIIIIEGSQGSGKTHMVNYLKSIRRDGDVIFYKYGHVSHMKNLDFEDIEPKEAFHYFTISNTLTILELHKTVLKDKVIVFDRGIFSAYVWSILRNRLNVNKLNKELHNLLDSTLYENCHVIRVTSNNKEERDHSDLFDNFTDSAKENYLFDKVFEDNIKNIECNTKNNSYTHVINNKDFLSEAVMMKMFDKIIYKNNINKLK